MPTIRVNGLNLASNLGLRHELEAAICKAVIGVEELKITKWKDIPTFFPMEPNAHSRNGEILIEVIELWKMPGRTKKVQDKLATALTEAVYQILHGMDVCCFVHPLFDMKKQGFCIKRNPNNHKD